jgi:NAD(P)-dependent dehydrogenase (short-subunit alcohol dehydrogenase family)
VDDLNGKTAVITGAASGIGLELAEQFGAAGMNLVLGDVEKPALDEAVTALTSAGHQVAAMELDVRDLEQIQAFEVLARERFTNVHVLCNNAGVGSGGPVPGLDDLDLWRWTIDVDLWGVIYGCKVFLPAMLEHGEPAHVVNTASMAGLVAPPLMGAYNVSKFGVVALSETLAKEMLMTGSSVGVSVLCPAFVQTGIADSQRNLPEELRGDAADSAVAGAFAGPNAETAEAMSAGIRAAVAGGIDTSIVGEAVVSAVRNNSFWILTHEETKAGVSARAKEIVQGYNPRLTNLG